MFLIYTSSIYKADTPNFVAIYQVVLCGWLQGEMLAFHGASGEHPRRNACMSLTCPATPVGVSQSVPINLKQFSF
jgi:hypothetical protein